MENIDSELYKNSPNNIDLQKRSNLNIKGDNEVKSIELGRTRKKSVDDILNQSDENVNKIHDNLGFKRRTNVLKRSYSNQNSVKDVQKDMEEEEKLKNTKVKNKTDLIEERQNVHKSFMNFLALLHSALFIAIIVLQYEVNLRYNIRSSLTKYFEINADFNYMGENESFPQSIFKQLATRIQTNSFWFNDKKYEIVTNVRVTQRVSKFDNFTSLNLYLSEDIHKKLAEKQIKNNYPIDPFSDYNAHFESNLDLSNGHKYQIKDTFLNKGGYMMYFNVSTLMGVTANTDEKTYSDELNKDQETASARKKVLLDNLISEFKKFFTPTFTVLMIDFVIANHELGYHSSIIYQVDFKNDGYYYKLMVDSQNVSIYAKASDYVRTAIEIIFTLVTLLNLVHIFYYDFVYAKKIATLRDRDDFMLHMNNILPKSLNRNMREIYGLPSLQNSGKNLNNIDINMISDSEHRMNKNENKNNENPQLDNKNKTEVNRRRKALKVAKTFDNTKAEKKKHMETLAQNWTWAEFFKSYFKLYIANALDLVRNIALILSIILIIKWVMYVAYILQNEENILKIFNAYNPVLNFEFSDSIIEISTQFRVYIKIMAVTAIFVFLRLIKVCEPFFPTLTVYIIGFKKSLSDILSFFMLFFLIIFGISLILYFYYSVDIDQFDSLIGAFLNNLFFFVGSTDFDLVYKMFDRNNSFTIVYFLAVGMFIKYAFNRILLAIILYNFDGLKYSKGNRYKCVTITEFKETVNRDFIYSLYCNIKRFPKIILKFLCCGNNKKKRKLKAASKHNNQISRKSIKPEESFNLKGETSQRNNAEDYKTDPEKSKREGNLKKQNKSSSSKIINNNDVILAFNAELEKEKNNENDLNKGNHKEIALKSEKSHRPTVNSNGNNQIALSERVLTLEDLRFVYSRYMENFEMISRNPYFDSPEDIDRVNIYYEKKYEANFKRNIMYLVLLMFLILSIFFNVNSPWRYGFTRLIDNAFYGMNYAELSSINSGKLLDDFLINQLPSVFSKSKPKEGKEYFMFKTSYLIGDKFFLTKKRQKLKPGTLVNDKIRDYESINIYKNFELEDKQNVTTGTNLLVKEFVYDNEGIYSYMDNGGLVGLFDINDYYRVLGTAKRLNDTISDGFDNFIVLEFMIENLELGIYAKYTIISIFEYGYFYYNSLNVDILSKSFGSNHFEIFRFIFIIVIFFLIIYETIEFIRELRQLNDSYNTWFIKRKIATSEQAKGARKFLNSELIRKLKVILNPVRASMFLILLLIYVYIIMFIISVIKESNFYSIFSQYSENLKDLKDDSANKELINLDKNLLFGLKNQFTSISSFKEGYDKLSAFLLFFASLRIIFSLNIGKYFYVISQIAVKTLTKNLMIVLLLFLILPSFIFYTYLIFGVIDVSYRSFVDSILSNFLKLFDFRNDISDDIDHDMKTLYVILFGFIMNLIILNLFVSIINSSYQKVKSKIFYSSENFSWIKVIFFCCNRKKIVSNTVGKEIIQNEIENFVKTHEAEPMVNLTAEFRSHQEFANFEIEKLKQVNESLAWIHNRTQIMQYSLICKDQNQSSSNLSDNRFKNVDEDLMNLQYFGGLKYQMELANSLEKDVLDLKESFYKFSVYLMSQKKKNVANDEDPENEKMVKELLALEKEYMDLITDIEELRKIKNEIDETARKKDSNSDEEEEDEDKDD